MTPDCTLSVQMVSGDPVSINALLGQGVRLRITTGNTLKQVLVQQIGFDPDYVEKRVQTIFVNARPIDDIERARIDSGAVIALSAAMPGLVGATLRRGGHLAAMRRNISQAPDDQLDDPPQAEQGLVTLKLFNMVAREAGPAVLAKGIWLPGAQVRDLLERVIAGHTERIAAASRDGVAVPSDQLLESTWPQGWVVVCLNFPGAA